MAQESLFSRSERFLAVGSALLALGLGATLITGCDQLSRELEAAKVVLTGGQSPLKPKTGLEAAKAAHAELLQEIFRVVLLRPPQDENEFGVFWDALNQGATLEGVYNGFVHSSIYRRKEQRTTTANDGAIQSFAKMAAELNRSLVAPVIFDESMAKPLEEVQPLSEADADSSAATSTVTPGSFPKELRYGVQTQAKPSPAGPQDATEIAAVFRNASLFTLKRVVGDLALKVIAEQKARGQLSNWYGAFAAEMASKKVDFGLELRNKADEAFHAAWAKKAPEDRLIWEVLNRVHRVLNAAEGAQK